MNFRVRAVLICGFFCLVFFFLFVSFTLLINCAGKKDCCSFNKNNKLFTFSPLN